MYITMFNVTQNLRRTLTLFFGFLIIFSVSIFYFISKKEANIALENEAGDAMLKTAKYAAQNIDSQLQARHILLETIANRNILRGQFGEKKTTLEDKIMLIQGEEERLKKFGFKRFGFLDTNGWAFYPSGRTLYLGDKEHFQKALKGENFVSSVLISRYENAPIFVYTTPILDFNTNEINGVLFASLDADKLSDLASSIAYGKSGYAFMIDNHGKIIAHKDFSNVVNNVHILDDGFNVSSSFKDIALKMLKGEVGRGSFIHENKEWGIAYAPIVTSGWSIAIVAPNAEIHARANNLKESLFLVSLLIIFIALIFAYIIADLISRYHKRLEKEKEEKEQELLLAKNKYEKIFENNAAGIFVVDENRNIITINERIEEMFGYEKEEIIGHNFLILHVDQKAYEMFTNYYTSIENDLNVSVEYQFKRKNGEAFWCEFLGTSIEFGNNTRRLIWSVLDIDKRKKIEKDNLHLKQLYATLSQCNQAIVYSSNETELFNQICKDTVKFGGMKMAWIGLNNSEEGMIKPVASDGEGTTYLQNIGISIYANTPFGRGPIGTAFREDHPVWIQDFEHDPSTTPWHERSIHFGWKSSAAIPLHKSGEVVGVFAIYSDELNMFNDAIQALLLEMARDIDYALDSYDKDAKRTMVEGELHKLSQAVEQSPSSIIITDLDTKIVYVNTAFMKITGYSKEEVLGKNPHFLSSGKTPTQTYADMWAHLVKGENWKGEFINKRKDGVEYIESVSTSPLTQVDGTITNYMAIKEDITTKKEIEARINHLANFDHLTGLPSRLPLADRFKYLLSLSKRSEIPFAVFYLDLDHFKEINDTLGHKVGDMLLIEAANRLQTLMREVDIVSRLGGDEFVIILPDTNMQGSEKVAKKLLEVISQPYHIETYELNVTVSIGIALFPMDGSDMETLSKNADTAMYRAKTEGRNGFRFFTESMQTRSLHNLQLSNALHHAIDRHELEVYFQPQISQKDGSIVGAEALLRWFHPLLGTISPAEFIPVAEESGQMLVIGEWVLRETAKQAKKWMDEGLSPMVFAVNLSAYQFRHPSLCNLVMQILEETGLSPQYLELELTESMAMYDPQGAIAIMNNLDQCGIKMSIDDFGTGYSSLSYLKKFKVYKLKIDQSFVRDITIDSDDRAIVKSIIMMAKSLGLKTIAEGVETKEQLIYIKEQGCDEVQGYYYSKPLPVKDFELFVKKYQGNLLTLF